MKRSTDRFLTTHVGSLARPHDLLRMMQARADQQDFDRAAFDNLAREAVRDVIVRQAASGIDVVSDGEQSKAGFYAYVAERLDGIEPTTKDSWDDRATWRGEIEEFAEYYQEYFGAKTKAVVRNPKLACTGPIVYKGQTAIQKDLANLKAALDETNVVDAFVPALAPTEFARNEYYPTGEAYLEALGEAMREEYLAIINAGFVLQIDDPWLTGLYVGEPQPVSPAQHIEMLNHALRGIPQEQIRYHTCYGINQGPRIHDVPLRDIVDLLLTIDAGAYSFEAANPRHQHEWHVWENTRLPDGKILIPGLITHAHNIVEHPELIADLLETYARLVGRENVIAGADCGFSSQATFAPEVHPKVVWKKFEALAEGARLASDRVWRS